VCLSADILVTKAEKGETMRDCSSGASGFINRGWGLDGGSNRRLVLLLLLLQGAVEKLQELAASIPGA
jgi:hypothetical protein